MNIYNVLVETYTNTITNLFTISGNFNDVSVYDNKQCVIKNKLFEDLANKNHILIYNPSNGLSFFDVSHQNELYELAPNLKREHDLIFKKNYIDSKYNIVAGLHTIKEFINTYNKVRETKPLKNLIVFIDYADIVFPTKPIEQMGIDERMAISVMREITSNNFNGGKNVIILLSESYYAIGEEIRDLSTNYHIEVELPTKEDRINFISFLTKDKEEFTNETIINIANKSAGINLMTLGTLIKKGLNYLENNLNKEVANVLTNKLGQYVELFQPRYGFENIIGYQELKDKASKLIKRMNLISTWRAIAYVGPTGSGKDFHTEAFLYEANLPILKLKNIKSKWYGETAIIIENIKQVARSFDKVCIFKPEADKLFPDPENKDAHQADQELAGLFLDWMSDSRDLGKIFWIFNTSRPQMFPVDFQRRIEIKLPVLDITNEQDRFNFIVKMFEIKNIDITKIRINKKTLEEFGLIDNDHKHLRLFNKLMENYSSDNIRMIVNEVNAEIELDEKVNIIEVIKDINVSNVVEERNRQTMYAKEFSTYKSLI